MASDDTKRHTGFMLKVLFRAAVNIGLVFFLQRTFPVFFVLQGGIKAVALVGLTLTILNWIVVPILSILSLPIKLFAWIVAFFLVNAAALWLTATFIAALHIEGISLMIGGGLIGWIVLSFVLGIGNWLVRAVLR